ncbi:phospholipase A2 inhibitor and Ly6/PLAUR domain-containing protein-like [Leptodactylus fuscus]|uniref:phospholipase A2 inhibitor and Ly6/PLAUR domain-containing protein-like n=1 Tax=Leptodactylus fuscus TaxID=238119 RepID=UPI003F4E4E85
MECSLDDTSSTCLDSNVTCSFNNSLCGFLYKETIIGGNKTVSLRRTCTHPSDCNINGTASTLRGQIRIASMCCSDDYCTPTIPTLPTTSAIPNGLLCPSCVSNSSIICETSYALQCTGDEEYCFSQSIEVSEVYGETEIRKRTGEREQIERHETVYSIYWVIYLTSELEHPALLLLLPVA